MGWGWFFRFLSLPGREGEMRGHQSVHLPGLVHTAVPSRGLTQCCSRSSLGSAFLGPQALALVRDGPSGSACDVTAPARDGHCHILGPRPGCPSRCLSVPESIESLPVGASPRMKGPQIPRAEARVRILTFGAGRLQSASSGWCWLAVHVTWPTCPPASG